MSKWRGLFRSELHTPVDDTVAWCDCESEEYVTTCQEGSPCKCCLQQQIQRVRHVVLSGSIAAPVLTHWDKGYNAALDDVYRAMEGNDDD